MNTLGTYFEDFFSLFFPQVCAGCGEILIKSESIICIKCKYNLPYTNFHDYKDNLVAMQFWGKVPFIACTSYLYFKKGSLVQNLIHNLKYNNQPEVGIKLGEMFGLVLKNVREYCNAEIIMPVPLHPTRVKKRGYNQSEYIAQGLSSTMNINLSIHNLYRTTITETQTKKSRFSRYENMKEVFAVKHPEALQNKHILLVDDVITTGSTIEACCTELLRIPEVKISIVSIAFAC